MRCIEHSAIRILGFEFLFLKNKIALAVELNFTPDQNTDRDDEISVRSHLLQCHKVGIPAIGHLKVHKTSEL